MFVLSEKTIWMHVLQLGSRKANLFSSFISIEKFVLSFFSFHKLRLLTNLPLVSAAMTYFISFDFVCMLQGKHISIFHKIGMPKLVCFPLNVRWSEKVYDMDISSMRL